MRRILLLCLLYSAKGYGQTTFTTKYLSYLLKSPISSNAYPSETNIYDTIYTHNRVIGIKLLDTAIRNKGERFLLAAFKNNIGYVPFGALDLSDDDFQKIRALNSDPSTALLASHQEWVSDSLRKVTKHRADSLIKKAFLQNIVNKGLAVLEMAFEETQFSTVNFKPSIVNYSKKTIKYASFHLVFFNPVSDVIGRKVVKLVGPIDYQDLGGTIFEDVIYTKQFGHGQVEKLIIEYMDKTFRTYTSSELDRLSTEGRL